MRVTSVGLSLFLALILCACGSDAPQSARDLAQIVPHQNSDETEVESEIPLSSKARESLADKLTKPLQNYYDARRAYEAEKYEDDEPETPRVAALRKRSELMADALANTLTPVLIAAGMTKDTRLIASGDSQTFRVYAKPNITLTLVIKTNAGKVIAYELTGTRKKTKVR